MNEILPGTLPPIAPAPVAETQRLKLIDALRGAALLGILLMNIPGFAMPDYFWEPFANDLTSVNFWVAAVLDIVFEGKMRALFGMIFGAGVLLFVLNKERSGKSATWVFYRRMFWLIVFGLIHAHLILWAGDILYLYGFCGMIVYLCRKIRPGYLVLAVPLVALLQFTAGAMFYQHVRAERIAYVQASAAVAAGQTPTEAQTQALDDWRQLEQTLLPSREEAAENTRKMKSDYATVASEVRPFAWELQTTLMPLLIWDSLALMLLGMAMFKWGFLTGQWSNRGYWKVMAIGYGIGLPLVIWSSYHSYLQDPTLEGMLARIEKVPIEWFGLIYPFQRILLVMAHVAALILLYKSNFAQRLFRGLEAVGQMAFTNYIMHSVICTLFFFGYGLNYYAELEFYQIYFVVLGIWIVQLILSPLWLHFFLFGPLEWLWRSLTYWKVQPFVRRW